VAYTAARGTAGEDEPDPLGEPADVEQVEVWTSSQGSSDLV
jgi:hypothetical protein